MTTANVPAKIEQTTAVEVVRRGIAIQSVSDLQSFAAHVVASGLAPAQFKKAEQVFIAVQLGFEIGLSPMQALNSIAVINGRPTLYGDALPALAWASGVLEEFREWIGSDADQGAKPKDIDDTTAYCLTRRKGQTEPRVTKFSVAMAKRAGLWGKSGPWSQYPQRMLQMRARSWNFRDNLADVLKGMAVREEVADFAVVVDRPAPSVPAPEKGEYSLHEPEQPAPADDQPTDSTGLTEAEKAEIVQQEIAASKH